MPYHGLHHRLQRNICSGVWNTSSSPSSLTSVSAELFLSRSLLSHSCCCIAFSTVLKPYYHRGATSIADWCSSAQQWAYPAASWSWLCLMWEQLLVLSHEVTPTTPPTISKPCHIKPNQSNSKILWIYEKCQSSAYVYVLIYFKKQNQNHNMVHLLCIFESYKNYLWSFLN